MCVLQNFLKCYIALNFRGTSGHMLIPAGVIYQPSLIHLICYCVLVPTATTVKGNNIDLYVAAIGDCVREYSSIT